MIVGAAVILFDPIFQGLAISLMAGEVASLLLSRRVVPVLYYMAKRHERSEPVPTPAPMEPVSEPVPANIPVLVVPGDLIGTYRFEWCDQETTRKGGGDVGTEWIGTVESAAAGAAGA